MSGAFFVILKERRIIMKLLDGREVTVRRYQEQDELFLRADRIEIPASITAVDFKKKQGYNYKNNVKELDEEGHYRLEKFNVKKAVE